MRLSSRILLAALALAAHGASAWAQVAVVVNPKSGLSAVTPEQVASLYLGKSSSIAGGLSQMLDLPENHTAREQFYAKVTSKNSAQVKATWARLAFSGQASPPKELGSAADVKKAVAASPSAIGYIDKAAVDASVKVVLLVE
jgi:ABC-type phosphate transport system substrate-binding protein